MRASLVAQTIENLSTMQEPRFNPEVGKIPRQREWVPTAVFFPGEFPWTEESGGLQPMGSQRSDTTECLTQSLSLQREFCESN